MKVLLVEDDQFHAGYLSEALQLALPDVEDIFHATNGLEGEQLARRHSIQSVVMDLQMKERNGIDAARTIWRERPQTRILFWSNYSDEAYLRGIARIVPQETSYGYVLKTATQERLHLALRGVFLESQIVVDQEIHRVQQRHIQTHDTLTDSEYAVLLDMALGLSDKVIAVRQGLSLRTVQNRLLSLYDKLGVDNLETVPADFAINKRTRAITRALNLRAINAESLESAERDLQKWLDSIPSRSKRRVDASARLPQTTRHPDPSKTLLDTVIMYVDIADLQVATMQTFKALLQKYRQCRLACLRIKATQTPLPCRAFKRPDQA